MSDERRSESRATGSDDPRFAPPVDGEKCPHCDAEVQFCSFAGGLYRCVSITCGKFVAPDKVVSDHVVRDKWAYTVAEPKS